LRGRQSAGSDLAAVERAIIARRVEWDIDPSLDRVRDLVDMLGSPQRAYPVIHITGTNGKSSTARMIEALLRERGLRTGRYTSPHLHSITERIAIDGEPITAERFVEVYSDVLPYVEMVDAKHEVPLSFFEILTGMAFAAFAEAPVDVAVVEVGLGGTWDATNVADGTVAVVTPIGLDHMDYLGSTVEEIAAEKAGIVKPGATAVLAAQPVPAAEVLMRRAAEVGATVAREGLEFGVLSRDLAVGGQSVTLKGLEDVVEDVFLPLFGAHQAGNAACALAAVEAFSPPVGEEVVRAAFAGVRSPGRLEIVRTGPTVLVDAAHNPAGMASAAQAVSEEFGFTRLAGVVAVMADKDAAGMLAELEPVVAEIVVTRNSSARSMQAEDLAAVAESIFGADRVRVAERLDDAIETAIGFADEEGDFGGAGVLITGSVVTAADALLLLRRAAPGGTSGGMP
jgi:dihydrofolate synthase/folylpolyglutamate synthase